MALYYPQAIIDSRFNQEKRCIEYYVSWRGYKECTWERANHNQAHNIVHRTDLVEQYNEMSRERHAATPNGGFAYYRVSTSRQSRPMEGHTSIEVQRDHVEQYCADAGIDLLDSVSESYSASNISRLTGLRHLLDMASRGHTIFVYDASRFSRDIAGSLAMLKEVDERGIRLYFVKEKITYPGNASQRFQLRSHLNAATFMSELLSERVRESVRYRRDRGGYVGGVAPFGYTTERGEDGIRRKVADPAEMVLVHNICRAYRRSGKCASVAMGMHRRDTKIRGRPASTGAVRRIVKHFGWM